MNALSPIRLIAALALAAAGAAPALCAAAPLLDANVRGACLTALKPYSSAWVSPVADEVAVAIEGDTAQCKALVDTGAAEYPIPVLYLVDVRFPQMSVVSILEVTDGHVRPLNVEQAVARRETRR